MELAPSVRTFSYEKRSTELIGQPVHNKLGNPNKCLRDPVISGRMHDYNFNHFIL